MVIKTSEMSTTLFKGSSVTMFDSTWCSFMYELKSTNTQFGKWIVYLCNNWVTLTSIIIWTIFSMLPSFTSLI
jgi:hypothetical protein